MKRQNFKEAEKVYPQLNTSSCVHAIKVFLSYIGLFWFNLWPMLARAEPARVVIVMCLNSGVTLGIMK